LKDFFGPRLCFPALFVIKAGMAAAIVQTSSPVTLLGGGTITDEDLAAALAMAPEVVAADGGANMAAAAGIDVRAVIGDLDSVSAAAKAAVPGDRFHRIAEQDSTDFEKCLLRIDAPLIVAVGFSGPRADHAMAVLNTLVRHRSRACLILGGDDVVFPAPRRVTLDLAPGTRVSLFPMDRVRGRSQGLRWPIDGITFMPSGPIGTSNEALGQVELEFDADGMLIILPRKEIIRAADAVTMAQK
jgi:thiamine pyrophosphokinase